MSGALQAVFQNQRSFITVPGAPTIGTATATGATTATVAYTAPASNGGATITLYTATSSPGSITGTLATAGSGTITVSGLTASTAYTFTVKATNSVGQSAASAASNSITTNAVSFYARVTDTGRSTLYGGYIDSSGNCYVTGAYTFGANNYSVAIKYTSAGVFSSANSYNVSAALIVNAISAISSTPNIYTITPSTGSYTYVTSINTSLGLSGNVSMRYNPSITGLDKASGPQNVALDSSNNIYLNYNFNDPDTGAQWGAVSNCNSSGVSQNFRYIAATELSIRGVVTDTSSPYLFGYTGASKNYIAKLNSSTMAISSQATFSNISGGSGYFLGASYDSTNSFLYVFGSNNSNRALLVKYNTSLVVQWAVGFSTGSNVFYAGTVDSSGNVYLSGTGSSGATFIAKYNSSGTIQWQREFGGFLSGSRNYITPSVSGTSMMFSGRTSVASGDWTTLVLPTDGSKTGTLVNDGSNSVSYTVTTNTAVTYGSFVTTTPTITLTSGTLPAEVNMNSTDGGGPIVITARTPTIVISIL